MSHSLTTCRARSLLASAIATSLALAPHAGAALVPGDGRAVQRVFDAVLHPAAPAAGDSVVVSNCEDAGAGSLRDAVANLGTATQIDLSALSCSAITLSSGEIALPVQLVTIVGPGRDELAIDASGNGRIFSVDDAASAVAISDVTLRGGHASSRGGCLASKGTLSLSRVAVTGCVAYGGADGPARGGGVAANEIDVVDSRITGNLAMQRDASDDPAGGGLYAVSKLSLSRSLVAYNTAGSAGGPGDGGALFAKYATIEGSAIVGNIGGNVGGAWVFGSGSTNQTTVEDSVFSNNTGKIAAIAGRAGFGLFDTTIAFNHATSDDGAAVYAGTPTTTIEATVIADNDTPTGEVDLIGCATCTISGDHDAIMSSTLAVPAGTIATEPHLSALGYHGGTLPSIALLDGSPLINAGPSSAVAGVDVRGEGYARSVGAAQDIGAYEIQTTGHTRTVQNCADDGAGSLRQAVANSVSGDVVDLTALDCAVITLSSGAIAIPAGNFTLHGPGAEALTIDGYYAGRVVEHAGSGTLTIDGITLANGYYVAGRYGGCVFAKDALVLSSSVVRGCTGNDGAGVYAHSARIDHSRILENTARATTTVGAVGAAVLTVDSLDIEYSTIDGNFGSDVTLGSIVALGALAVRESTVSNNHVSYGGGVVVGATGSIVDSTISGNLANGIAGVLSLAPQRLHLIGDTIADNVATGIVMPAAGSLDFGGVAGVSFVAVGAIDFESTIAFGNLHAGDPNDIGGSGAVFGAHALVGAATIALPPDTISADPLLGPLQDNGGPTWTQALGEGSPAIDAGSNVLALDDDQRGEGFVRVVGDAADIGAFEVQAPPPPPPDRIFADGFDGA